MGGRRKGGRGPRERGHMARPIPFGDLCDDARTGSWNAQACTTGQGRRGFRQWLLLLLLLRGGSQPARQPGSWVAREPGNQAAWELGNQAAAQKDAFTQSVKAAGRRGEGGTEAGHKHGGRGGGRQGGGEPRGGRRPASQASQPGGQAARRPGGQAARRPGGRPERLLQLEAGRSLNPNMARTQIFA